MTYTGPVGIIGCNILLLGEPEDALLEDQLGLGGSHGYPWESRKTLAGSQTGRRGEELEPILRTGCSLRSAYRGGSTIGRQTPDTACFAKGRQPNEHTII